MILLHHDIVLLINTSIINKINKYYQIRKYLVVLYFVYNIIRNQVDLRHQSFMAQWQSIRLPCQRLAVQIPPRAGIFFFLFFGQIPCQRLVVQIPLGVGLFYQLFLQLICIYFNCHSIIIIQLFFWQEQANSLFCCMKEAKQHESCCVSNVEQCLVNQHAKCQVLRAFG